MSFEKFDLSNSLLKAVEENAFKQATLIQQKVIPLVLQEKDIMAKAQTGSGKTAAFVLPILEKFSQKQKVKKAKISSLILTPTRELALQVAATFNTLSLHLQNRPKVVTVIGGELIGEQLEAIQKGCDIVVATTGRLLDIIDKKQINLSTLEFFVLDEADKMLDLGFALQLESLLKELPKQRQNLLFSATYPQKMLDIAAQITKDPIEVKIDDETSVVELIKQRAIEVNIENRSPLLRAILKEEKFEQVLVFMANKRSCDNLAAKFRKYGFNAESFHGDLDQEERVFTLEDFKAKDIDILFATDIAARGLHVDNIACVVNYDLPRSPADYIHRIGRTGRAGKEGTSISFITYENSEHFKLIEKRCEIKLIKEQISGFELTGTAPKKQKGKEAVKGKRKSKKDKLREQALKDSK